MLKTLISAFLYTALSLGAIPAGAADLSDVAALREGEMKKLTFHSEAKPLSDVQFTTMEGAEQTLAEYRGQWVVLNLWATWCAPCRKEMPSLDALNQKFGENGFAVLPVAVGHNPPPAIVKFFDEAGITSLPMLLDPKSTTARGLGVMALPVTILISPEGEEVARMTGDADWFSPSAQAIVAALVAE